MTTSDFATTTIQSEQLLHFGYHTRGGEICGHRKETGLFQTILEYTKFGKN